jgi:hypothetical protein
MSSLHMAQRGIVNSSAHISEARKHGAVIRGTCINRKRGLWIYRLVGKPRCNHGASLFDKCSECGRRAAR